MKALALNLLSRTWSGLVLAAAVGGVGALLLTTRAEAVGVAVSLVAAGLAVGSVAHMIRRMHVARAYPPPGKLVDVGGYRLHVLAEGPVDAGPPIVWFGGSHASGASMHFLHAGLRGEFRSILIDRPGAGWSDPGPFPRSTAREADEIVAALDKAGERGPFILVGYSFGGLLVANVARRRPDLVAELVLFDATPLDTIIYGPRLGALAQMRREMWMTALLRLFGYTGHLTLRRMARIPAYAGLNDRAAEVNGEAYRMNAAVEGGSKSELASYSIFGELSPEGVAACAWETSVYDGDLGDLPLVLVAPGNASEAAAEPEVANADSAESRRMLNFFASSRERYMAASTRSRRVVTPPGTTHQFVVEEPDFVLALMRDIAASHHPAKETR